MKVGLIVPVYKNFPGFAELMESVDIPVHPIVIPNWRDNIGVSKGWNAGLEQAIENKLKFAIVANDDVIFKPRTMLRMIMGLSNTHEYDLVTGYNTRDEDYRGVRSYIDCPDFACYAVRPAEFVDKFGWFDENFTPAYFEDNDMHYRMKLAGGKAVKRTDAPFYHKGSVTQNWGNSQVVTGPMFEANRAYYTWKWGRSSRRGNQNHSH